MFLNTQVYEYIQCACCMLIEDVDVDCKLNLPSIIIYAYVRPIDYRVSSYTLTFVVRSGDRCLSDFVCRINVIT